MPGGMYSVCTNSTPHPADHLSQGRLTERTDKINGQETLELALEVEFPAECGLAAERMGSSQAVRLVIFLAVAFKLAVALG